MKKCLTPFWPRGDTGTCQNLDINFQQFRQRLFLAYLSTHLLLEDVSMHRKSIHGAIIGDMLQRLNQLYDKT